MENNELNIEQNLSNQTINNTPNQTNQERKKGKGFFIIILIIIICALSGYIVYNNFSGTTKCDVSDNKLLNTEEKNDKLSEKTKNNDQKVLNEINKVYEDMFNVFSNSNFKYSETLDYYQTEYSDYFTDKGCYEVFKMLNDSTGSQLSSSIFNTVNQGKRVLTIEYYNDDIVVATGLFKAPEESEYLESDEYSKYIIFKRVNNVWKIDMFE